VNGGVVAEFSEFDKTFNKHDAVQSGSASDKMDYGSIFVSKFRILHAETLNRLPVSVCSHLDMLSILI
jgi:hypothetical protein